MLNPKTALRASWFWHDYKKFFRAMCVSVSVIVAGRRSSEFFGDTFRDIVIRANLNIQSAATNDSIRVKAIHHHAHYGQPRGAVRTSFDFFHHPLTSLGFRIRIIVLQVIFWNLQWIQIIAPKFAKYPF